MMKTMECVANFVADVSYTEIPPQVVSEAKKP